MTPHRAEGRDLGDKASSIAADSRTYDFSRLAPLDFAFIESGHDFATAQSDSAKAYAAILDRLRIPPRGDAVGVRLLSLPRLRSHF